MFRGWRGLLAAVARIATLAAVYFGGGQLGLALGAIGGFAAPVWPSTGISLAALLIFGKWLWPGVVIGALLVNLARGAPPAAALGIAIGNVLEVLVTLHVLERARFEASLARPRDIATLTAGAALGGMISASVGLTSLALSGAITPRVAREAWLPWLVGDVLSDLVIAPLLFVVLVPGALRLASRREMLLASAFVLVSSIVILGGVLPAKLEPIFGRPYLIYPALLWPSLRAGPVGSAVAMVIVSVVAITATALGHGPFAKIGDPETPLLGMQLFLGVVAVTQLSLAAAVAESRLRDKLMSVAAHELRGPIGTIGLAIDTLREAPAPAALDAAQRQVHRLAALVEELLDATLAGTRRLRLNPKTMDLAALAAEVVARLEPELRRAGCPVVLRAESCPGAWDALKLDQLLTNLMSNAARHAPGAEVTVTVETHGDRVRLTVEDRGPGIHARDLARIFDAFRSLDRKGPGLGLGLHIAREIAAAHHGTVHVESLRGHGAKFIVELPRTPPSARRTFVPRWPSRPRIHQEG